METREIITTCSLVEAGMLVHHNIYRTVTLIKRESGLVTGMGSEFPDIIQTTAGNGLIPNCLLSLANDDSIHCNQWGSLRLWHAGLSCQSRLREKHSILYNIKDVNFHSEFNNTQRSQKIKDTHGEHRVFLVYELRKGTIIPNGIGIEMDGDNHVTPYPTGVDIPISNIANGATSFTIDVFVNLQSAWRPFALLKLRAKGFPFPEDCPPDSDVFPFRDWVSRVVKEGEAQVAADASYYTEEYVTGSLAYRDFLSKMIDVAEQFGRDCDYEEFVMNVKIYIALKFGLNLNCLMKTERYFFSFVFMFFFLNLFLVRVVLF
jgi:hypothetical protein